MRWTGLICLNVGESYEIVVSCSRVVSIFLCGGKNVTIKLCSLNQCILIFCTNAYASTQHE